MGSSRFAFTVALKAVLIGALTFAAIFVWVVDGYYATALVLLALALLIALSLIRTARTADRLYADFVQGIAAAAYDAPLSGTAHFPALGKALHHASAQLADERQTRSGQLQALEALIDALSSALFAVDQAGEMVLANRAAWRLAGEDARRLSDMASIGSGAAARLMDMPVGAREILSLTDGRRMLASTVLFRGADGATLRLISLQGLASELSAVETQAWQDLARILAHEMMNSLTPIVSMSESLQQLLASPDESGLARAREAAEIIGRRSAGLTNFVERYRQAAELPRPELRPLRMRDVVRDLEGLIAHHGVPFHSRIDPPDLIVHADPEMLQQALINLLKNAAEAVTDVQCPEIHLTATATDRQITIEINDNGPGLPDPKLAPIFTPFYTTKPLGSGIGLSVARQIAVAHGGELTARQLSKGAIFCFALPR